MTPIQKEPTKLKRFLITVGIIFLFTLPTKIDNAIIKNRIQYTVLFSAGIKRAK